MDRLTCARFVISLTDKAAQLYTHVELESLQDGLIVQRPPGRSGSTISTVRGIVVDRGRNDYRFSLVGSVADAET